MVTQIVSHQLVYRKIITFFNTSGYFNWWLIANVFSGHLYGNFSSTGGGELCTCTLVHSEKFESLTYKDHSCVEVEILSYTEISK